MTASIWSPVSSVLEQAINTLPDYASLRLYTGTDTTLYITGYLVTTAPQGIAGFFTLDATDTTSADNSGTIFIDGNGRRWKRAGSLTVVTLEQFGASSTASTATNLAASNLACLWCATTGATLRLSATSYPGARIEVHGSFSVEGNGATVDFLGIGYTYIAGTGTGTSAVPTAWPLDSAIYNAAAFVPAMYSISAPVAIGDDSISFVSATGLAAGDIIFLAGNPTSMSSVGNYIPASCEYAQVLSIVGNTVTFNGKIRNTYTTAGAAFKSAGLARNCRITGLRLKSTGSEAYQCTIRSAFNVILDGIEFAGRDTLGSVTFSESLNLRNFHSTGAGGNWSFARGSISALLDGLLLSYRSGMTVETSCIFVEESFYDIGIRGVRGYGASFSARQLDLTGTVIKRAITIMDSMFDTIYAPGGATSPFQCGTVAGIDIESINCVYAGAVGTPNASIYPGITGTALCWVASNQVNDKIKFSATHFKASNTGASFKAGSGVLGTILHDALCTYEVCDEPITDYTPRGAWNDMSTTLLNGYTVTASSVSKYRYSDKYVYCKGRLNLNGAAAGSNFFLFPVGRRPLTEAKVVVGTDTAGVFATLRVNTGGSAFYVGSNGTPTYIQLDQLFFPVDI